MRLDSDDNSSRSPRLAQLKHKNWRLVCDWDSVRTCISGLKMMKILQSKVCNESLKFQIVSTIIIGLLIMNTFIQSDSRTDTQKYRAG